MPSVITIAVQGKAVWIMQCIAMCLFMGGSMRRLAYAHTLEEQRKVWNGVWFVRFCKQGPSWLVDIVIRLLAVIFLNRFVLW